MASYFARTAEVLNNFSFNKIGSLLGTIVRDILKFPSTYAENKAIKARENAEAIERLEKSFNRGAEALRKEVGPNDPMEVSKMQVQETQREVEGVESQPQAPKTKEQLEALAERLKYLDEIDRGIPSALSAPVENLMQSPQAQYSEGQEQAERLRNENTKAIMDEAGLDVEPELNNSGFPKPKKVVFEQTPPPAIAPKDENAAEWTERLRQQNRIEMEREAEEANSPDKKKPGILTQMKNLFSKKKNIGSEVSVDRPESKTGKRKNKK